jgi:hypothetical protein
MISSKVLTDVIVTALEGGSNHFITDLEYPVGIKKSEFETPAYSDPKFYQNKWSLIIHIDERDENQFTLNDKSVGDGWTLFAAQYPTRAASILDETYDADDADLAMQFFLFGAYIYG